MYYKDKLYIINLYIYLSGGDVMLGQCVRAKVVKPIGYKDESGYLYPLNFAQIYDTGCDEFAFILGIDHAVKNFDGRVIAVLEPKSRADKKYWIIAPKSTRFINLDIMEALDTNRNYPNHRLVCLYESSSGIVVYRKINDETRFLLIKNNRSTNWGFPKGHIEKGETKEDAALREVLEETGIHVDIHEGFECVSKYKIKNKIDKAVSLFVGTTSDIRTNIQESEIEDYVWLTYDKALSYLKFENDKNILTKAYDFLIENNYIDDRR